MARDELPREDLMREAVALVRRMELEISGESDPVVVGFRRDGSASFFFGDDPALHFNSRHELRRGYTAGKLIKAEKGRLAALTRARTESQTQLVRHDLSEAETATYLADVHVRLNRLLQSLEHAPVVLRQFPEHEDLLTELQQWFRELSQPIKVAQAPNSG